MTDELIVALTEQVALCKEQISILKELGDAQAALNEHLTKELAATKLERDRFKEAVLYQQTYKAKKKTSYR